MDEHSAEIQFNKLEKALRLASSGSNWFLFDPIDLELLEDLQNIVTDDSQSKTTTNLSTQNSVFQEKPIREITNDSEVPQFVDNPITDEGQNLNPMESNTLDSLRFRLRNCERCQLCSGRRTIVFGQGNLNADIVFVGEAPGEEEDKKGLAFVGKAGKLLSQIIHSIGLNRKDVYICNVIKCRPPGNRNPTADEIANCSPFLFKQIEILKPKLIVTMGNIDTKTLLPK
ncbi:uracil-DNA glycosylase, partial [bacterium]|nr:uracil-DNA glycosylase [bacterium]